LKEKF